MTVAGDRAILPEVEAFLRRAPAIFIEGRFVPSGGGAVIDVYDPATGEVIARAPDATPADVDVAVNSAHTSFADGRWRNMRPADRERTLLRLADLIEARSEAFAQLETLEQGKAIGLSRTIEVGASIDWTRYAAGLATKIAGRTFDLSLPGGPERWTAYSRREPVGVVGAIAPWNFPLMIGLWKILPALAAGCSVVLKPSEFTPLTALMLAETATEAGVPPGTLNIVTGRGATAGRALASHPRVAKLSFTGSAATGKTVGHAAIDSMKRFTLELGGKNPAIVLQDAKLERVIPGLMAGGLLNGGQVCAAASRIYVEERLYQDVVAGLAAAIAGLRPGPGLDPDADLQPLASAGHKATVCGYIAQARSAGATIIEGPPVPEEGYFVSPALVLDAPGGVRLVNEEVFGPVLNIVRVDSADEALTLANRSDLGLTASVWTQDIDQAMRMSRQIEAGTIWVNSHVFIDPNMPFGGFKHSGLGRDFGPGWLDAYTEEKSICIAH